MFLCSMTVVLVYQANQEAMGIVLSRNHEIIMHNYYKHLKLVTYFFLVCTMSPVLSGLFEVKCWF